MSGFVSIIVLTLHLQPKNLSTHRSPSADSSKHVKYGSSTARGLVTVSDAVALHQPIAVISLRNILLQFKVSFMSRPSCSLVVPPIYRI